MCENCKQPALNVVIHGTQLWCWPCHNATKGEVGEAPGVIPDQIPGGVEIKHGICNEDGTPRKFYSKSEMRRAAFQKGLFQGYDTPKVNPRLQEAAQERLEMKRGK